MTGLTQENSKRDWRAWAKKLRHELDTSDVSENIAAHLDSWEAYQSARHILSYMAFGSEISLAELHKDRSKTFYTTRTHTLPHPHLTVHVLTAQLEAHRFGYLQPPSDAPGGAPDGMEIVLVPGLCFDKQGGRLGYGMGFYDRLLPTLPEDSPRVAITTEALLVDALPQEDFDVRVTHIVTEKGLREV